MTEGRQTFHPRPRARRNAALTNRYQQLLDGVLSIEDLDDEEIARGQIRDVMGHFREPPRVIPWTMHAALREAMSKRMERKLLEALPEVLDALISTAKYGPAEARVKAAAIIMDRALGKVPDKQEITQTVTAKWEDAAAGGRLFVDLEAEVVEEPEPEPEQPAIEAEIVERPRPRPRTGVKL